MTNNIIDVSHWEAPIDFKKVADSGIIAVVAKATQGAAGVDDTYAKYKKAAASYDLKWGSFHFGTGSEVDVQVDHYLKTVDPEDDELVSLDFEPNPHGPTMTLNQGREFVTLFEHLTGRYPVLYGGHWLKESLSGKKDDLLAKCPLWLAQYGPKAVLPPGWKAYTLWQYTDGKDGPEPHTVAGIGKCDRSQFDGSEADLKKQWPFT
jgi:GH25 family lysozyme M1 (1,4-beta-N-acetylmuramidase)